MGKRRALVYFPGLGGNREAQGAASGVAQGLCLFSRSWWQWVSTGSYLLFLSWWQWVSAGPYLLFFVLVAMGKRRALFTFFVLVAMGKRRALFTFFVLVAMGKRRCQVRLLSSLSPSIAAAANPTGALTTAAPPSWT